MASARAAVAAPTRSPRPRRPPAAPSRARPKASPKRAPASTTKGRTRSRQRTRSRGAIAWIAIGGLLLAGVVFVNLAVLRLNLRLDSATHARSQLKAENHSLQSQLSATLASTRIQKLAHQQDGLVPADPSSIDYLDLGR